MPTEVIKTTGSTKESKPGANGGNNKTVPLIGIVKDNIDPTRSGRIKVLLADKGIPTDSDSSGNWVSVSYLSNFFGMVKPTAGQTGLGDYVANPSSYGEWHAPPDIGTKVICIFVNGDPNYGFYIGCIPEADALQMVPAIGSSDNIVTNAGEANSYGGATRLPVTNINTNDKSVSDSNKYLDTARPVHSYTASIMSQQGIIRDPIRGPISSSASRETASRVGWGVSTPGRPIYEGGFDDSSLASNLEPAGGLETATRLKVIARRGGHSFVMDDGDVIGRDQLIRIRTALGHQILMSDDGQTLMILHSNGQSYIELGKEGTIDMYSTNSVNIRTQGDLNLHADQNVNIHAMENLNLQGKNIQTNSEEDTKIRSGKDIQAFSIGNYLGKAGGAVAFQAGGEASLVAGGIAYVNGSKVNLNSGGPGTSPQDVAVIPIIAQTDTLFDEEKGFIAAPAKLLTIATRAPAHAPWSNAGQGVDVKTTLNASDSLPAAPSAAVEQTTTAAATNATPPAIATAASVPATTPSVSKAMGPGPTNAAIAGVATTAAQGPAAAATTQGAAVVSASGVTTSVTSSSSTTTTTANGVTTTTKTSSSESATVAVGSFAMTPKQMEQAGVLKPGASTLINGIATQANDIIKVTATGLNAATSIIDKALPSTLFTAIPGAENLTSFVKNTSAQAQGMATTMQKAQTALTNSGVLTGNESAGTTAGLVTAAATVGPKETIAAISQVAGKASSTLSSVSGAVSGLVGSAAGQALNQVSGALNQVSGAINTANKIAGAVGGATNALKAIGAGTAAAGLADKLGGLGGLSSALNAMKNAGGPAGLTGIQDAAKGIATNAFNSIKDSFKAFKPGVPQNLTAIAKEAAAKAQAEAGQLSQLSATLTTASKGLTEGLSNVGKAAGQLTNAIGGVTGALSGASAALKNVGGSLSTLADNAKSISNTVNTATASVSGALGAVSSLTGSIKSTTSSLSSITSSMQNTVAGVSGAVSAVNGSLGQLTNKISGSVGSFANTLNSVSTAATSITSTANKITGAIDNVSSLAGAGPALAAGGTAALSTAASTVAKGATAAVSSQVASGISNLAGGIKSVSSVLDKATGAVNSIPGAGSLTGLIKDAQTSVMSGLQSAEKLANDIGGQLDNLTALVSKGLPAGAAAELASSVSALSAGGAAAIKLPAVGFNTTDRGSITSQIKSVLGNPKIPTPNLLGEITQDVKDQAQKLLDVGKKYQQLQDKLAEFDKKIFEKSKAYNEAELNLPAGDPAIEKALAEFDKATTDPEYAKLLDDIINLDNINNVAGDILAGAGETASGIANAASSLTSGLSELTGSLTGAVGGISRGASSLSGSLTSLTKAATSVSSTASSVNSTIKSVTNSITTVTSSATQITATAKTALSSVTGSGATAIEGIQTKINTSKAELNNTIAGIIGPSGNG
jgi:uncharacterized phage infection (PIP) family protein YhgE